MREYICLIKNCSSTTILFKNSTQKRIGTAGKPHAAVQERVITAEGKKVKYSFAGHTAGWLTADLVLRERAHCEIDGGDRDELVQQLPPDRREIAGRSPAYWRRASAKQS